jgi:hypothetical protein
MYLLFTDETNLQAKENVEFFSYGGLIISSENLPKLHTGIEAIRIKYGYGQTDKLKFDTNARPKSVSVEAATRAKQEVIQLCVALDCKFIAYVVLHAIAQKQDIAKVVMWGASHVIGKFNFFLKTKDSYGMVAMDRLPDGVEFEFLAQKFSEGLSFPDEESVQLDRIVLHASTCLNASHASSAMDVVLGSWRYCINNPRNKKAAEEMMDNISKLIWCEREGNNIYAFEKGLIFRPKTVKVDAYQAKYDALLNHVNGLLAARGL